jgi:hypothetical protein
MNNVKLNRSPFSSLFRDRFLTGFVVFCIFLNGFVPRFSIPADDYNVLSQIIASQSILLHFFSLSTLPEKIVNELFKEQSMPQAQHKKLPAKQNSNSTNSSSDYTLINADARGALNRHNFCHRIGDQAGNIALLLPSLWAGFSQTSDAALPGVSSVFLILVVFFFLLPRSSLADGAAAIIFNNSEGTQLDLSSWVFSLIITNSHGRPL